MPLAVEIVKQNGPETLLQQRPALTTTRKDRDMAAKQLLPLDYLRQCLTYDPDTGLFEWLTRPIQMFPDRRMWKSWNTRFAGKPAFTTDNGKGYLFSNLNGQRMSAHRLAYLMGTGVEPDGDIDHINGDPRDNRLINLRVVTHQQNHQNRKRPAGAKTVANGVYEQACGRWYAYIKIDGVSRYLGGFDTAEEAIACRAEAERALGYHPNHGRPE